MRIRVDRFTSDEESTISHISVDSSFVCFGLEDEFRAVKVPKETRIPAGTYRVGIRTRGKLHQRYKERFNDIHQGMLELQEVPGFSAILIHCGNTQMDTEGCLLVGSTANTDPSNMSVSGSAAAYRRFYPQVIESALAGSLSITIEDNDRSASSEA
jgi:Family of unknown function (DUF5675)